MNKELLLKDLCARLPYGVKFYTGIHEESLRFSTVCRANMGLIINGDYKYYLRPMSSMTEEEMKMFDGTILPNGVVIATSETFDYLNSIHVDYRGLIEKGLVLAVTEENNPYKLTI